MDVIQDPVDIVANFEREAKASPFCGAQCISVILFLYSLKNEQESMARVKITAKFKAYAKRESTQKSLGKHLENHEGETCEEAPLTKRNK